MRTTWVKHGNNATSKDEKIKYPIDYATRSGRRYHFTCHDCEITVARLEKVMAYKRAS